MSFHNLSISVLKVGRQLAGSKLAVAAFFMPLLLQSCIRDEDPVAPYQSGNIRNRTLVMGTDYRTQLFYNIAADSVIALGNKNDWDLAFSCTPTEGGIVMLNQARYMFAWNTNRTNVSSSDTIGFFSNRRWDAANRPDSIAIGNVKNKTTDFWIDRGLDENGDPLPLEKITFVNVDYQKYRIKVQHQGEATAQEFEIQKDTNYNFIHFSLANRRTVAVEPPKKMWDLAFTQYMHTFTDPYTPYLVTGVLLNTYETTCAADSTTGWDKIDRTFAQKLNFSNKPDVIGYDWKAFINSVYITDIRRNYIVRTAEGFYYKIRFIDFYDNRGTKGSPKFEVQKL